MTLSTTPESISEREAIARYLEAEANLHAEAAETEGDLVHARIARRIDVLARRVREGAGIYEKKE